MKHVLSEAVIKGHHATVNGCLQRLSSAGISCSNQPPTGRPLKLRNCCTALHQLPSNNMIINAISTSAYQYSTSGSIRELFNWWSLKYFLSEQQFVYFESFHLEIVGFLGRQHPQPVTYSIVSLQFRRQKERDAFLKVYIRKEVRSSLWSGVSRPFPE